MEALNHISADESDAWKDLILRENDAYLEGAKAPDAKFKDFKNHVLHVTEGEWGGARDAAMEWYGRSVEALRQKDWNEAAFALGVLSHYYADVCQPFHTGQTEEEGAMHRAVEWSIVKSADAIFERLSEEGYPEIESGDGVGFVADMVLNAAKASNPHYQTFIDHYDLDVGVKNPPAGIDETMFDAVCECAAYAISGLGVLISRAVEEAGVAAPKSNLTLRGYLSTLNIPIHWVTGKLENRADRKTVEKMYREFQKTGKVIKTLPEDDKQIRKLHARNVIRVSLKELDEQPLGPIGSKHVPIEPSELDEVENTFEDEEELEIEELEEEEELEEIEDLEEEEFEDAAELEAPAKLTRAEKRALKKEEKAARKAEKAEEKRARAEAKRAALEEEIQELDETEALEDTEETDLEEDAELETTTDIVEYEEEFYAAEDEDDQDVDGDVEILDLESADPDNEIPEYETAYEDTEEFDAELAELAAVELDDDTAAELEAAMAAERDFQTEESASAHLRRDRLNLESPVVDAPSIGKKTAKRLAKAGIRTVIDLLDADPEYVAHKLDVGYITPETIITWQDQAMLMMEVPGLRTHDVQVLIGAGIRTGEDLANASAHEVFRAAIDFLETNEGERVSRFEDEALAESEVAEWIDLAKQEAA